jgi:hypothetical protein
MGEKKRRDEAQQVFEKLEVKETRLEGSPCLSCGKMMDCATNFDGQEVFEGGIAICLVCGHIMAYDAQLKLRELTDDEMTRIAGDKKILMIQEARGHVMRWYGKMWFRFHRGSLSDSMRTVIEIKGIDDIVAAFNKEYPAKITRNEVKVRLYDNRPDQRIGWPRTYLITVFGAPIGFCNERPT